MKSLFKLDPLALACAFFLPVSAHALMPMRQAAGDEFFQAALCKPPYTTANAAALYDEAEKLGKPDTHLLTTALYALPKPVTLDGFTATAATISGSSVGVLVEGERAAELAERYRLTPETPDPVLRANVSKGFASKLADQPDPERGTVSIVARESRLLPGKTLLSCELLSREDEARAAQLRKALGH